MCKVALTDKASERKVALTAMIFMEVKKRVPPTNLAIQPFSNYKAM